MDTLLLALAGCMMADIQSILEKSRVPLDRLEATVVGERADEFPRRYTGIEMVFRLSGPGTEDAAKVERAVALSRDTYCSVMHTLRQDVEIDIRVEQA
jgi:putative redox protein